MNWYKHYIGDYQRGKWHEIRAIDYLDAPKAPGVYVVLHNNQAIYIGQSMNLRARLREHNFRLGYAKNIHLPWTSVPDTDRVTLKFKVSKRIGDWAMWEVRLITRLAPKFNRVRLGNSRTRAA